MSFSKVLVDSVFGKSPEMCTKRDLCMFLQRHRTIANDLALSTTGTKSILIERVTNAIKQGMYLLEDSSEEAEQECVFGLPDCASDGWQNQMEEIHMVCPVVTIASILHHMRPATGMSSIQAAAFRSLTEGHTVWKSGHVIEMVLNTTQFAYTWMKIKVLATMKQEIRRVCIAFEKCSHNIKFAHCTCPAGLSHSCIHVSAALWSMESFGSKLAPTSKPCAWIQPRSKETPTGPITSISLKKHKIFRQEKLSSMTTTKAKDFDPRPPALRGKGEIMMKCFASDLINSYKSDNMPLLVSVFIPPPPPPPPLPVARSENFQMFLSDDELLLATTTDIADPVEDMGHTDLNELSDMCADLDELSGMCTAFKASLQVSDAQQSAIEFTTRGQALNPKWFEARKNRLTASIFADVVKRKAMTLPDPLVKIILGYTRIPTWLPAIRWGQDNEVVARLFYLEMQRRRGHAGIQVSECGLFVDTEHGWLGASPDGLIYDPSNVDDTDGVLEIKCPYSMRTNTISEAAQMPGFYCQ
ncbi:uncharacterized protein LOC134190103 [Corticium candelabrum]|uniref:uncharacterized protein LOC134190103 n=1 Tax=Corticium candelabrum TaxID=121492 RepID=UPI002E2711F7|nr:uncharacterized protein LOC134190103 [Corticium candelabrum]XP_062514512.1 uncharacterized protein LOC134190103 [Corticium candelabrum]XP_062514513.1 uncharacterized protein LOC134190103 [Corticium candelabrum]